MNHKNTDEKVPTDIRRACLLVSSIENSLKIYHEILGLKFWLDEEMNVSGEGLPAGEPNSWIRLVILQANDPLIGNLALLEYLDPPLPPRDADYPKKLGIGGVVFVLNHKDVQSVYDQIRLVDGVHIQSAPHDVEFPAPNNGVFKRRLMSFFDPDGYFFEVAQLLN
ncbi:hypothetical protein [Sphingorhabdus sp. EL138]|uniref:hypothetical protein n=1 Tax=Sphingorhabdus sp. EL138 TaxID=2073156 RepID=UPI000D68A956|nr:hypothetical protein [Sphingorhabdus sp. EL138]